MGVELNELKFMFGKVLGETYRVQKHLGMPCSAGDATIYGLLNGIERAVDDVLLRREVITNQQYEDMCDVLDEIQLDREKLDAFQGFYGIESALKSRGIDRSTAISILRYMKARDVYVDVIAKMDTMHSPTEARRFELADYDK